MIPRRKLFLALGPREQVNFTSLPRHPHGHAQAYSIHPRPPRTSDLEIENGADLVGLGPRPQSPDETIRGVSTFTTYEQLADHCGGHAHRLPAGSELPEGLSVHADGADITGNASGPPEGHRSIYPDRPMTHDQFVEKFQSMSWEYDRKIR